MSNPVFVIFFSRPSLLFALLVLTVSLSPVAAIAHDGKGTVNLAAQAGSPTTTTDLVESALKGSGITAHRDSYKHLIDANHFTISHPKPNSPKQGTGTTVQSTLPPTPPPQRPTQPADVVPRPLPFAIVGFGPATANPTVALAPPTLSPSPSLSSSPQLSTSPQPSSANSDISSVFTASPPTVTASLAPSLSPSSTASALSSVAPSPSTSSPVAILQKSEQRSTSVVIATATATPTLTIASAPSAVSAPTSAISMPTMLPMMETLQLPTVAYTTAPSTPSVATAAVMTPETETPTSKTVTPKPLLATTSVPSASAYSVDFANSGPEPADGTAIVNSTAPQVQADSSASISSSAPADVPSPSPSTSALIEIVIVLRSPDPKLDISTLSSYAPYAEKTPAPSPLPSMGGHLPSPVPRTEQLFPSPSTSMHVKIVDVLRSPDPHFKIETLPSYALNAADTPLPSPLPSVAARMPSLPPDVPSSDVISIIRSPDPELQIDSFSKPIPRADDSPLPSPIPTMAVLSSPAAVVNIEPTSILVGAGDPNVQNSPGPTDIKSPQPLGTESIFSSTLSSSPVLVDVSGTTSSGGDNSGESADEVETESIFSSNEPVTDFLESSPWTNAEEPNMRDVTAEPSLIPLIGIDEKRPLATLVPKIFAGLQSAVGIDKGPVPEASILPVEMNSLDSSDTFSFMSSILSSNVGPSEQPSESIGLDEFEDLEGSAELKPSTLAEPSAEADTSFEPSIEPMATSEVEVDVTSTDPDQEPPRNGFTPFDGNLSVSLIVVHPPVVEVNMIAEEIRKNGNALIHPSVWVIDSTTPMHSVARSVIHIFLSNHQTDERSVDIGSFKLQMSAECSSTDGCSKQMKDFYDFVRQDGMNEALAARDIPNIKVYFDGDEIERAGPMDITRQSSVSVGIIAGVVIGAVALVSLSALGVVMFITRCGGSNELDEEEDADAERGVRNESFDFETRSVALRTEEGSFMISNFGSPRVTSELSPWVNEVRRLGRIDTGMSNNSFISIESSDIGEENRMMSVYRFDETTSCSSEMDY